MVDVDIEANLRAYLKAREPTARHTSFDYCFNYFREHYEQGRLPALVDGPALQLTPAHPVPWRIAADRPGRRRILADFYRPRNVGFADHAISL